MLQRPKTQKQFSKHCETNQTKFCIQYFAVAVYFVFRAEEICRQISMFQFAVVAVIPRRKLPKRHTHTHTHTICKCSYGAAWLWLAQCVLLAQNHSKLPKSLLEHSMFSLSLSFTGSSTECECLQKRRMLYFKIRPGTGSQQRPGESVRQLASCKRVNSSIAVVVILVWYPNERETKNKNSSSVLFMHHGRDHRPALLYDNVRHNSFRYFNFIRQK